MKWVKISRNTNYSINEKGEVRNDVTGNKKVAYVNPANGYLTVDLYKSNKPTKVTIHRLLAETFIPNPDNKPCVDHKDGDRKNNRLSNLRWATYSENNSRFGANGVRSARIKVEHYTETRKKRGGGHLAWGDIDRVLYFDRISDAAEYFKCSPSNLTLMLKSGQIGRRGKMRGYRFLYRK